MTLEFQAPFQINPYAETPTQRSLAQLGQTFNSVGDQALKYRQQQIENQRQSAILKIQQAQANREGQRQAWEYGQDAGGWTPQNNGGQPLDLRSPYQPSPLSNGGASMPSDQGASPSSSMTQGTMGPQSPTPPNTGYSPQGQPMSMAQPVDHSSHFQNWMSMGQPSSYDHPDYGGTGQNIGMNQPQSQPQPPSGGGYNANDPYGIGMNISQVGSKRYELALGQAKEGATGRVLSKMAPSIFGNASPQDLALSGTTPDKIAELQASQNYKNASFGMAGQRITNETQQPAQKKAGEMYDSYVSTDTNASDAMKSLSQAQKNPAMFNTALFNVGKVLGITSRNPQMVIQAIADGNPTLAGQINDYVAKKGSGKLTNEMLSGLQTMIQNVKQTNQQSFETRAIAHVQQNAKYYKNDIEQAKSSLFPGYKFGQSNQIPTVNSQDDYDALPSGSSYYDSGGKLARKK